MSMNLRTTKEHVTGCLYLVEARRDGFYVGIMTPGNLEQQGARHKDVMRGVINAVRGQVPRIEAALRVHMDGRDVGEFPIHRGSGCQPKMNKTNETRCIAYVHDTLSHIPVVVVHPCCCCPCDLIHHSQQQLVTNQPPRPPPPSGHALLGRRPQNWGARIVESNSS
jgi:hypothetical protein